MRNQVLTFISACLYYSSLVNLVRWWKLCSGRHLIVLNYHRASGGDLRRHLLYLRRHYRLMSLESALEELYKPSTQPPQHKNQQIPLVLTFDDGYYDNYTHAFALARELQIPITIFLISNYTGDGAAFWWKNNLISHAQVDKVTIEERTYNLSKQGERKALAQAIDARVNLAVSSAEREEFLRTVCQSLAVPFSVTAQEEPDLLLTWAQVREMEASGWISFGAHTMHHPVLAELPDSVEIQYEIEACRTMLQQELGHPIRTFAYPHGCPEHIGDQAPGAAQRAGYDWAVTTIPGFNTPGSNPYLLRRFSADVSQHWLVIAARTSCILDFLTRLYRIVRPRSTSTH